MKYYLVSLNEFDARQILRSADDKSKERSKILHSNLKEVTELGDVKFETVSGTTQGLYWHQTVRFKDLYDIIVSFNYNKADYKDKDIMRLLSESDLEVYCDCPAFKYWGYKYISWNLDMGVEKETRNPKVRNPKLKGTVCKHLIMTLERLPFLVNKLVSMFREKELF